MDDVHYSSESSSWSTPQWFFDRLDEEFHFDLDPCATLNTALCDDYFTKEQDGLIQRWTGRRVFCNPPYGDDIGMWVRKCATGGAEVCVALLPARTDTLWFHNFILGKAEIRWVKGRLNFSGNKDGAPFPNMVCIWNNQK
jgi:phage N-6-adenine-methyltransferase